MNLMFLIISKKIQLKSVFIIIIIFVVVVTSVVSVIQASVIIDEYWFAVRKEDSKTVFIYASIDYKYGVSLEITESVQYIYACFYVIDTCVYKITYDELNAELVSKKMICLNAYNDSV